MSRRGTPFRHIITEYERDGYEYSYHATKGWRRRRILEAANPFAAPMPRQTEREPEWLSADIRTEVHSWVVRGKRRTVRVPVQRLVMNDRSRYTGHMLREIRAGRG